jgi:hypothetical protein
VASYSRARAAASAGLSAVIVLFTLGSVLCWCRQPKTVPLEWGAEWLEYRVAARPLSTNSLVARYHILELRLLGARSKELPVNVACEAALVLRCSLLRFDRWRGGFSRWITCQLGAG